VYRQFFKGVVLGSLVASLVLIAGTAAAAPGVLTVFKLGRHNVASRPITLSGATSQCLLQITNRGTAPALGLTVKDGQAPLRVNSSAPVANLNADLLDGKHASDFASAGELANLDADTLGGKHASDFVQGGGVLVEGRVTLPSTGTDQGQLLELPGLGTIDVVVDAPDSGAYLNFTSSSSSDTDVWSWPGSSYLLAASGATVCFSDMPLHSENLWTVLIDDGIHMATVHMAQVGSNGSLHVVAQALVQ
jgi:hypothetical protein